MAKITITIEFEISPEQISDLLVTAFEGGINYWCGKVNILSLPDDQKNKNLMTSDVLSVGGTLELVDVEDENEKWILTLNKFIEGVKQFISISGIGSIEELIDYHDASDADYIIQHALFGEQVFC